MLQGFVTGEGFIGGQAKCTAHEIRLKPDVKPIRQPLRRAAYTERALIRKEVSEMLEKGVIRPSSSPWSSPVHLVPKNDGTMRFCIDYRKVNSETVLDAFPLPHIGDLRERLRGAQYFSCLDLMAGYWQIPLQEESKPITAFSTTEGHFEFNVLPFGLSTAAAAFQRAMNYIFRGLSFVGVYWTTLSSILRHCKNIVGTWRRY